MSSPLDQPLTLPCGVTLPNRLLKSAMTEGLADAQDRAGDGHVRLYRRWSAGGCGLLLTGNVMVDRRFLERAGNVVMDGNGGEAELRAMAAAGQSGGSQIWMQINHPGRQCQRMVNAHPLSPSEVQLRMMGLFGRPQAMTGADIEEVIERFVRVAGQAKVLGFNGVQIHAAHGYLISQFHSPYTNLRQDEWGGSLENRARLLLRILDGVRQEVGPHFPVAIKLNSADFQKGGFSQEDSARIVEMINGKVDLLEISGGNYEQMALFGMEDQAPGGRASTRRREAYFLDYAKMIRQVAQMPVAVTGGFRDRALMEEAVAEGEIDLVGLARPLCCDPELATKLLAQTLLRAPEPELSKLSLGANSQNRLMKNLHAAGTYWFYAQIEEIAAGRDPDFSISHLGAIWRHLRHDFRRQRARRRVLAREQASGASGA